MQAGSAQRDKNTQTAEDKVKAETKRLEGREDARYAHQTAQTNRRYAHEAEQNNKTRLHELALQEARNSQTMQLAMMDREDNLFITCTEDLADRRQQSIMMLIKGLAQLGQGFSL